MHFYLCFSSRLMLNIVFKANCFIMRNSLLPIKQQGGVILLRWAAQKETTKTFNSGDSGQGDSVAWPLWMCQWQTQQPPYCQYTCTLPQQMRVPPSAARTSNLAPGTLDQPIVFDLLLNNLGETLIFSLVDLIVQWMALMFSFFIC